MGGLPVAKEGHRRCPAGYGASYRLRKTSEDLSIAKMPAIRASIEKGNRGGGVEVNEGHLRCYWQAKTPLPIYA